MVLSGFPWGIPGEAGTPLRLHTVDRTVISMVPLYSEACRRSTPWLVVKRIHVNAETLVVYAVLNCSRPNSISSSNRCNLTTNGNLILLLDKNEGNDTGGGGGRMDGLCDPRLAQRRSVKENPRISTRWTHATIEAARFV